MSRTQYSLLTATLLLASLAFFVVIAAAQEEVTATSTEAAPAEAPMTAEEAAKKKKELRLHADFASYTDALVRRLNEIHSEGRNNMVVVKDGDVFRASYHLIEKKSAVVRESPSRPGQYTGILRYQDTIYQAEGESEAASRNGEFSPVPGTARAVSEIFQWMKGGWN